MKKILALDFGLKRTGVAITDERNLFAFGLTTISSNELMEFLKRTLKEENIGTIVLGYPTKLDQSDSHTTENVRLLKTALHAEFPDLDVEMVDERFTSKIALHSLHMTGASNKTKKNKAVIDEISATIILQSYLGQK